MGEICRRTDDWGTGEMVTILIGGDVCPLGGNSSFFRSGDAESLFHDLLLEFAEADLVIANLECPLIESPEPITKTGPVFGENSSCINGIRAAEIDVLCLANNHILDHGPQGLENTIRVCAEAGIATVGAGPNLAAARRILVRKAGRIRVGILAMAESEFSITKPDSWGANPLSLIDYVRNVSGRRDEFDYLIVLLHGGPEFMAVPSPRLRDTCRFLVEMGTNAVIVQHPHSLGGYENYRGGHIVYGQGALVMDEAIYRDLRSFHEGVLVKLTISADGRSSMELLPFVQSDPVPGARLMNTEGARKLLLSLAEKSARILDDDYMWAEWLKFCLERKHGYLSALLAHNRVLRRLNRNGLIQKVLYGRRSLVRAGNVVSCETHREVIETLFREGLI